MTEFPKRGRGRPRKDDPRPIAPPRNSQAKIILKVAQKTGFHKTVIRQVLHVVLEAMRESLLEDGELRLSGFGTFWFKYYPKQEKYNPFRRKYTIKQAQYIAVCRPSPLMADMLERQGPDSPAAELARIRYEEDVIRRQKLKIKRWRGYLRYRDALLAEFLAKNEGQSSSGS